MWKLKKEERETWQLIALHDPGLEHKLERKKCYQKTFLGQLEELEYGLDNNIVLNFLVLIILLCWCATKHPKI